MTIPDLTKSGRRLRIIDSLIMRLLRQRMIVAKEVAAFKMGNQQPIVRAEIETLRINEMRALGEAIGLDPNFVASIEHTLINESCKVQLGIMEGNDASFQILPLDRSERNRVLKANLRALCREIAPVYDRSGGKEYPATKAYVDYEDALIREQINWLEPGSRKVAVDLGCAVGRVARLLSPHFEKVYGYDLSQHMISEAWDRRSEEYGNISFETQDLEEGIPLPDCSVDLVVMGLGTASDLPDLTDVLQEIYRVLRERGRFVLSFYNRDALMYQEKHITIDGGLSAEVNVDEECLTVHMFSHEKESDEGGAKQEPGRDYLILARPYALGEMKAALAKTSLLVGAYRSYPTVASVVPRSLLLNEVFMEQVAVLDRGLESANAGAYHLVVGSR